MGRSAEHASMVGRALRGRSRSRAFILILVAVALAFRGTTFLLDYVKKPDQRVYGATVVARKLEKSGRLKNFTTKAVKVRIDGGATYTVDSDDLYDRFGDVGQVRIQVTREPDGSPKRIRYAGRWHGTGPPTLAYALVGGAALALAVLAAWAGLRSAQEAPGPPAERVRLRR